MEKFYGEKKRRVIKKQNLKFYISQKLNDKMLKYVINHYSFKIDKDIITCIFFNEYKFDLMYFKNIETNDPKIIFELILEMFSKNVKFDYLQETFLLLNDNDNLYSKLSKSLIKLKCRNNLITEFKKHIPIDLFINRLLKINIIYNSDIYNIEKIITFIIDLNYYIDDDKYNKIRNLCLPIIPKLKYGLMTQLYHMKKLIK